MVPDSDWKVQKYFCLLISNPVADSWFEWADLKFSILFPFSDKKPHTSLYNNELHFTNDCITH